MSDTKNPQQIYVPEITKSYFRWVVAPNGKSFQIIISPETKIDVNEK